MKALRTIFAIIASNQGVRCALAAYKALPLGDKSRLIGLHVSPIAISYGLGAT